jgi:hypothetical protein
MSDYIANPFEKPKRFQIKLPPIHVEAIHARSSVRYGAARLLADIAEKSFPQVTYDDEVIEKLRAIGQKSDETVPGVKPAVPLNPSVEHPAEPSQPKAVPEESEAEETNLAPVIDPDTYRKEEQAASIPQHESEKVAEPTVQDINAIRQAVRDSFDRKKAA